MILQSLDLESFIVNRQVNQFLQVMASWQNKTIGQFYEKIRNKVFYCKAVSEYTMSSHFVSRISMWAVIRYISGKVSVFWQLSIVQYYWDVTSRDSGDSASQLHYCGNVKTDKLQHCLILLQCVLFPVCPGQGQH